MGASITLATVELNDLGQCLIGAGEITRELVVFGYMNQRIEWQLLPPRRLDLHAPDVGGGVYCCGGYYGPRTMRLTGLLQGSSPADLLTRLQLFDDAIHHATLQPLVVEQIGGLDRTWQAICTSALPYDAARGMRAIEVTLDFLVPQPFAEGDEIEQPGDTSTWIILGGQG